MEKSEAKTSLHKMCKNLRGMLTKSEGILEGHSGVRINQGHCSKDKGLEGLLRTIIVTVIEIYSIHKYHSAQLIHDIHDAFLHKFHLSLLGLYLSILFLSRHLSKCPSNAVILPTSGSLFHIAMCAKTCTSYLLYICSFSS